MNKVCLVLSLGLLMTSTQQFCNRRNNQSFAEKTQNAKHAHEAADKRYQQANENYEYALAHGASPRRLNELATLKDDAREEYRNTQTIYQQAQRNEQEHAKECIDDRAIAQQLAKPESAHAHEMQATYDAPPSYAQATGADLAYKVAAAHTLLDDIERTNSSIAEQFIKSRYKKYNNCWWCK